VVRFPAIASRNRDLMMFGVEAILGNTAKVRGISDAASGRSPR